MELTDYQRNSIQKLGESIHEGKTTRILDQCIQILFKTGRCLVKDHEGGDNESLLDKLLLRLSFEHSTVRTHIKTTKSGLKIILLAESKAWSKVNKNL